MSDSFVARQPIFDGESKLTGYELLFRPTPEATESGPTDSRSMTSATLVSSVLTIGLDQLTGPTRAWVNFPRELLLESDLSFLDPQRCVIEVDGTEPVDDTVMAACRGLRERGFTLALDELHRNGTPSPLLDVVEYVKLTVPGMTESQLRDDVRSLGRDGIKLVAQRVENSDHSDMCRRLGFSYFQGYYFSRPEVVKRREFPSHLRSITQLIELTRNPTTHDLDIEAAFRTDPALAFKLLRIVNSAAAGGRGVDSIHHAIRLIGRSSLYRWLGLLLVSSVTAGNDVDQELALTALERARLCEIIAERTGRQVWSEQLFLTGLLSTFDAILDLPMATILAQVKVVPEVQSALLREPGPYTPYLELAAGYGRGDWESAIGLGDRLKVLRDMPRWYFEACGWARDVLPAY